MKIDENVRSSVDKAEKSLHQSARNVKKFLT